MRLANLNPIENGSSREASVTMIQKERLVALLQKLVQAPSENPPGNEVEVAKIVEGLFRSSGLDVASFSFTVGRPNIVGTLHGAPGGNPLLLAAHLDTVPAGGGWSEAPFSGKIEHGRLYGRGATDDKCHVAILAEIAASLAEDKLLPSRDILFLAMSDEEAGGRAGLLPLMEKNIIPASEAVILDSSGFEVLVAQKGLIHAKVEVFGKKAHGAYPERGKNAIERAAKIICALKENPVKSKKHPLLGPPTINIGTIAGGERVNIVADKCLFEVDARFPPSVTPRQMEAHIRKVINSVTKEYALSVESEMAPVEVEKNSPLANAILSAIVSAGRKAKTGGSSGATLMAEFVKRNMPCVSVGFGAEGTEHAANEYVVIKDVVDGANAMDYFLKSYAGVRSK